MSQFDDSAVEVTRSFVSTTEATLGDAGDRRSQALASTAESAQRSLFSSSAITSHLRELGYPESSLSSMFKCGQHSCQIVKTCDCGVSLIDCKHSCNLRTCSNCSLKRKRRIRKQYLPFLQDFHPNKTDFYYFLTISPKNYDSFDEGLEHISKSFSKFVRLKYVKDRVKAGLYVIETKNTGKGWHVHLHAIVYGRWLDNRLRGKCLECNQNLIKKDPLTMKFYCANSKCNSQSVVVKDDSKVVSLFKKSSGRDCNIHIQRQSSVAHSLNYMLKYISSSKEDFTDVKSYSQYLFYSYKRRLISSFGLFYKHKPSKKLIHVCVHCQKNISFCYDPEIIAVYGKGFLSPESDQRKLLYPTTNSFAPKHLYTSENLIQNERRI